MTSVRSMILGVIVFGMSGIVSGAVVLDETFTDLSAWNVLDTPGAGATVEVSLGGGNLNVTLTGSPQYRLQGVESKAQYAVPAGGILIVDSYGTNSAGDGTHSHPDLTLSAFANDAGGFFAPWGGHYVNLKGWDAYFGDWAQSNILGYADLAGDNITTAYHSIITVDETSIKWYIETDFYENVSSPTALYTCPTSDVFSPGELAAGLYIDILAARYTSWFSGTCAENFDGVRVTVIPEPVSLVLFGLAGTTMLLRKKK